MSRLGVLGGTFDPIHLGHLAIAQEAAEQLDLTSVLFMPAARPPHKHGQRVLDVAHRVRMVGLAIADNPRFTLATDELRRSGPSYTVDTLEYLRRMKGEDVELYYIVGGDVPAD